MRKFFNNFKAFTLVELMIVIAIIGILSAVLYPSITGYFERARDVARKQNIRELERAFLMYNFDNGTFKIPNTGHSATGEGFINFIDSNPLDKYFYKKEMLAELRKMGYTKLSLKTFTLQTMPHLPGVSETATECGKVKIKDVYSFAFNDNEGKYSIGTFLEKSATQKDIEYLKTTRYAMGYDGFCTRWGFNYAVGNY